MTDQQQATSVATDLAARIRGEVLTAGDPGYDQARTPHFGYRQGRPEAVVRPADAGDVATAIETAHRTGLSLHVRGGGHHAAGHSTGDGLLVDVGSLTGLDVDRGDRTLWAGAGHTAGALTTALAAYGLAVGFGDTGTVGIGGITLGGGLGFFSRLHGMTIDNLLAAEIVTADGRVRVVDAEHEADLFWAIRGGGGNFGIATRFRYRAVPVTEVYGGALFLPATPETLRRLVAATTAADDELTVIASVLAMPPMDLVPAHLHGRLVIMAVCYAGDPSRGPEKVAPLREAGPPLIDLLGPIPYTAMFAEPAPSQGAVVAVRSMFVDDIDERAAAAVLDHFDRSEAWLRMFQFRVMGGAIARVDPAATAFAHRRSPIMATIATSDQPSLEGARQWTERLAAVLPQVPDQGAYIGFFGPHDGSRIEHAYPPATLARLRRIKATYDPTNLFRHNDNITPA